MSASVKAKALPADTAQLAERVELALLQRGVTQKRMFGGLMFLLNGNMLCCASKTGLLVRVGKDAEADALTRPHASPCMGTGRRMPGYVMVAFDGVANDNDLASWLKLAARYVTPLAPK